MEDNQLDEEKRSLESQLNSIQNKQDAQSDEFFNTKEVPPISQSPMFPQLNEEASKKDE